MISRQSESEKGRKREIQQRTADEIKETEAVKGITEYYGTIFGRIISDVTELAIIRNVEIR